MKKTFKREEKGRSDLTTLYSPQELIGVVKVIVLHPVQIEVGQLMKSAFSDEAETLLPIDSR